MILLDSLLDNDLYKFTMQQAVCQLYPWAEAHYEFINRGKTPFPEGFGVELNYSIRAMKELRLSDDEAHYLATTCPFLSPVYIDFLKGYRFDPSEVSLAHTELGLSVSVKGPWYRTILWEVPLMAMISELYCQSAPSRPSRDLNTQAALTKVNVDKGLRLADDNAQFADFGTRRRYSAANQEKVIKDLLSVHNNTLVGTSNVHFARMFDIKPIGTHAHEWFMFHGATHGYLSANPAALDAWAQVYKGALGIALTDTYTTDVFLDSFDTVKARLFDGVRHDSDDPVLFADTIITHYKQLGIDPMSKTIVFSDSLTTEKVIQLNNHCAGKIKCSFGIGTHLSNDVGVKSLNMVIKLRDCRRYANDPWLPVVKLSDSPGKHTGAPGAVDLCVQTLVF